MFMEQLKDEYECLILSMQVIMSLRKAKFGKGRKRFRQSFMKRLALEESI